MNQAQAERSRTRRFLVQALYQAQMTGQTAAQVMAPFLADHDMKRADTGYFRTVMQGIAQEADFLQGVIAPPLDRDWQALDPVSQAILLLGAFELTRQPDIPWKVAISEAVDLAKTFGPSESHRYVNAILDQVAKQQVK